MVEVIVGVMDRNSDPKLVSDLREQTSNAIFGTSRLHVDQQRSIRSIIGEAITNAYEHTVGEGEVSCSVTDLKGGISVMISNPSEGFCGGISGYPEDPFAMSGRGCQFIKDLIDGLWPDLQAFCGWRFDSNERRTIFWLLLCY